MVGDYMLTASPYTQDNLKGSLALDPETIHFHAHDCGALGDAFWIFNDLNGVFNDPECVSKDSNVPEGYFFITGYPNSECPPAKDDILVRVCDNVLSDSNIFFPIISAKFFDEPLDEVPQIAKDVVDGFVDVASLYAVVDGEPVFIVRTQSSDVFFDHPNIPSGVWHEGYYAILPPLSVGQHEIEFGGSNFGNTFCTDVKYILNVVA
jgi:hypothetical protein